MKQPRILFLQDGNRRWAARQGLGVAAGYAAMAERMAFLSDELLARSIDEYYVTNNSIANLGRPKEQLDTLFASYLTVPDHSRNRIRIQLHGNLEKLPSEFKQRYRDLELRHADTYDATIHYMLNWSLEDEIVRIYQRHQQEKTSLTVDTLRRSADITEPIDLIVRTGQRKRLSSLIPINGSDAEIYFLDILFPDLTAEHVTEFLDFYARQERTRGL